MIDHRGAGDVHHLGDIVELHERHDRKTAADDDRPDVGNRVEDAGEDPPDDVMLDAEPPECNAVATPTTALVNTWTWMKLSICRLISSRIWTVIFFFVSVGPAIFTSFRLKRSPVTSMK